MWGHQGWRAEGVSCSCTLQAGSGAGVKEVQAGKSSRGGIGASPGVFSGSAWPQTGVHADELVRKVR